MKRFLPYIGPLIGVTGLSLALYFHAMSVQERVPLFYIGSRATIVDASIPAPSQVQVVYRGRPVGATNVVAVVIYVWNDGRMPIRAADVLEPISIQLDKSCEILESRILKISRNVTKFVQVVPESAKWESAKYIQPISFDILEKGDGAAIQIIYAGKSDAAISLAGTIVGAGSPRILSKEKQSNTETNRQKLRRSLRVGYGTILAGVVLLVFGFVHAWYKSRQDPESRHRRMTNFGMSTAAMIVYILLGIFVVYDAHQTYSPAVPIAIWVDN